MANIIRRREPEQASMLGRWEPFRAVRDMFRMDPLHDLLRGDPFAEMESLLTGPLQRGFIPDIEVRETKDAFEFTVDLPGVREQNLEISVTGNRLTIGGEREDEERREGERYYAYERSYGSFSRSFTLPAGTDLEHIKAELSNGVLHVHVPKAPGAQPKRIEIAGAGQQEMGKEKVQLQEKAQDKQQEKADKAQEQREKAREAKAA